MAAIQDTLIDLANGCGYEQWRREATAMIELLDEDGGHDPAG